MPLVVVETAPSAPPEASLQDHDLTRLVTRWDDPNSHQTIVAQPSPDLVTYDLPTTSVHEEITLTIHSLVLPAFVNFRMFYTIGADGTPNDTEDRVIQCVGTSDGPCFIQSDATGLTITVPIDAQTVFLTVEAFYYNPDTAQEPYSLVTWGTNISTMG
ncbi:hypothetical protein [Demequina aestuarii]|uniref:hypothetical protein n=1 Tax=Demequina aestuarii TaxID=327095 RepID=UPI00128BA2A4|nr:hypothetical protein [Demequina aestuarii]